MIKKNNNNIVNVYKGSNLISKIYQGINVVYKKVNYQTNIKK